MPYLTLRLGALVRLKQQPDHLPDFVVMACHRDRLWIRQPPWPTHIQLCVNITQIAITPIAPPSLPVPVPEPPAVPSNVLPFRPKTAVGWQRSPISGANDSR